MVDAMALHDFNSRAPPQGTVRWRYGTTSGYPVGERYLKLSDPRTRAEGP